MTATDKPSDTRAVAVAVVTAALTTIATKLAEWGIDELRARYGAKAPEPQRSESSP